MGLNRQLANLPDAITTDTSNNVGIGGSPSGSYKFEVTGTSYHSAASTFGSTATATAFIPSGATIPTNGMYLSAANTLNFATNTTNRLVISSLGNVGIGIATPSNTLDVNGIANFRSLIYLADGTFSAPSLRFNNSNSGLFLPSGVDAIGFSVGNTEKMRITSGGNVGIGTSSPSSNINPSSTPVLAIKSTTAGAFPSLVTQYINGAEGGITLAGELYIDVAGNSTAANNAIVFRTTNTASSYSVAERMRITSGGNVYMGTTTGDSYAGYTVLQVGGNVSTSGGVIQTWDQTVKTALVSNGSGYGIVGTRTNHDLQIFSNDTVKMVVKTNGNVLIGTTTSAGKLTIVGDSGTYACAVQANTTTGSSYGMIINGGSNSGDYCLYVRNAAQGSPYIYIRGDGYLYSASAWSGSDRRLKENITDLDNGLDKVLNLKPRKFDFIDSFKNQFGFIAQEVQEVIPDAVSVFQEEDQMLAIKMDFIIPHLVKAIQEQQEMITSLQEQINALAK